jgi:hypothetical protein
MGTSIRTCSLDADGAVAGEAIEAARRRANRAAACSVAAVTWALELGWFGEYTPRLALIFILAALSFIIGWLAG